MSVTNTFSAGGVISATELNTNFDDLTSLATSVGNEQLSGAITQDRLADNNAISWLHVNVLPYTSNNDLSSPASYTLGTVPAADAAGLYRVVPVMRPGWECFLCAIMVTTAEVTIGGGESVSIKFRLNRDDTNGVIGNTAVSLDSSDAHYILAKADPIANPLVSMADGDYIDIALYKDDSGSSATARGVDTYFTFKHVLVG